MPRKPKKPCSYPGCPRLTDERYCEEHATKMNSNYEKYGRDKNTKRRYGRAWKRIWDKYAAEVYEETWKWLKERNCERWGSVQLIEQYAMSVARWGQCEEAISEYGMLAKHPTTKNAIASPYVSMSQQYMKQVNQIWYQIFQIVKENCSVEWQGATP